MYLCRSLSESVHRPSALNGRAARQNVAIQQVIRIEEALRFRLRMVAARRDCATINRPITTPSRCMVPPSSPLENDAHWSTMAGPTSARVLVLSR